ncbi:unnamed protein product [Hermetia illucens]|uniref:Kazal-like domain-containing protein n=1 Tax=Hermetia illucens TaxID=343691 RepID=A0A7R8UPK9_HERIL|nr:unnamed protein product [Hermetia illucens]
MKYQVLLLATLVAVTLSCETPCTRELTPVCGSDGVNFQVFNNECLMENENCKGTSKWAKTNLRSCLGFRSDDPVPLACVRMCPMLVMPVCGYNGKEYRIFGNSCLFGIENCLLQGVGEYENVPMEKCTLSEIVRDRKIGG